MTILKHLLVAGMMSASFAACSTNTASAPEHQAVTTSDADMFATYDLVNGFDIVAAGIGIKNARDPQVKILAEMVLRDHSAVQKMTRDLAAKTGVTYTIDQNSEMAMQHHADMARLRGLSGRAFDVAYLQYEAKFHADAIAAIENSLLPSIQNEEFKTLVTEVLPGFRHHLSETLRVAEELGVDVK